MNLRSVLILAVCASGAIAAEPDKSLHKEIARLAIPESLMPTDKQPLFMVRAEGVQIYKADSQLQWALEGPKATLRNYRTGEEVGTHTKGPTWTDAKGSKLVGKLKQMMPAPNGDAVPWLLLAVKNENAGSFAQVTHIQRVDTWGGLKPAVRPTKPGEMVEVPYQATYIFWGEGP